MHGDLVAPVEGPSPASVDAAAGLFAGHGASALAVVRQRKKLASAVMVQTMLPE